MIIGLNPCKAQNLKANNYDLEPIKVYRDAQLDSLLKYFAKPNFSVNPGTIIEMQGFRVQIYFGNERNKALELKSRFLKENPQLNAYLIYEQPNFKVRVGDFAKHDDAYQFSRKITNMYGVSFVVRDLVKYRFDPSKTTEQELKGK